MKKNRVFLTPKSLCAKLELHLKRAGRLVVLMDYDGTLIPLPRHVGDSQPGKPLLKLLRQMETTRGMTSAVVTGRTIANIRALLPLRKMWFVGIHGVELGRGRGPVKFLIRTQKIRTLIRKILLDLRGKIDPRFYLENKELGASVHLQGATPSEFRAVRQMFMRRTTAYVRRGAFKFSSGKRVIEIKPAGAHKGLAVDALCGSRGNSKTFCVALGDDRTDEDMFRSVRGRGVSVGVGSTVRGTRYRLRNAGAVRIFLIKLLGLWKKYGKLPALGGDALYNIERTD